jgi:hypothetical protein
MMKYGPFSGSRPSAFPPFFYIVFMAGLVIDWNAMMRRICLTSATVAFCVESVYGELEELPVNLQAYALPGLKSAESWSSLLKKIGQPAHRTEAGAVIDGSDVVSRGEDRGVGDWFGIVQVSEYEFADAGCSGKRLCLVSMICGEIEVKKVDIQLSGQRPHPWATPQP